MEKENYFEPDSRWENFEVSNREEYLYKFVIKGHFHKDVPGDILKDYKVVEYLMAHAYYYWPMYDEALNKVLRSIETALKIKAKMFGISLIERISKKGNKIYKTFENLIDEIFIDGYNTELRDQLHRIRTIRNPEIHKDHSSFMGGFTYQNMMIFVNILNDMFRDGACFENQFKNNIVIKDKFKTFANKLIVLEYDQPSILIANIIESKVVDDHLFLLLNPVLQNTYKNLSNRKYPELINLTIKEYNIEEDIIKGISPNGNNVKLYITDKSDYLKKLELYKNELSKLSQEDRFYYEAHINQINKTDNSIKQPALRYSISWPIVEMEYLYNKNKYKLC